MFFITIIGGNAPLLIPMVRSFVAVKPKDVQLEFTAQSTDVSSSPHDVNMIVQISNAADLQYALAYILGLLYFLAAVGYGFAVYLMLKRHPLEEQKSANSSNVR